ncbi:MAG: hypothetical protein MR593_01250 [Intestinibacter sp.]|uniref:hypothetical protein n=1 Tax=Intestinibacter sp. TaxID=1965304 RepID=UPI0025BA0D57|nr:hypothetical protein [Intestinibacter sp.]MCI6736737.1 hypothetical protein [Intestinibacter sp.]
MGENLFVLKSKENKSEYAIKIDISNKSIEKNEGVSDYESEFIVDYILGLDENDKNEFWGDIEAKSSPEENYITVNELYNICISKDLWKNQDDTSKMTNWIYNVINPNALDKDTLDKMLKIIEQELNSDMFNFYLKYILSKDENIYLEYISPDSDLYELILFEDILSVDYKDKYDINVDLDVDYIGDWWRQNILPIFKSKYSEDQLQDRLNLEIKKNEILDFRGENFKRFKNRIIEEINKEMPDKKDEANFEVDEKKFLEKRINASNPKNISELEQVFGDIELKYDSNKEILKNYYSGILMQILENKDEKSTLDELEKFINKNEEFLDEDLHVYIDMKVQKEIQRIEQELLNDICDVKDLKSLEELHNKILLNGDFVKCEDIESIIFTKLESIISKLNLAEINDEENIKIGNRIYDNTSSIDIKNYPVAEILICRDIEIDLNNTDEIIDDLKDEIDVIKNTVLKNCMFNCDYYNVNIQISGEEACYSMKFRYLKDLLEYIKLKEKKSFVQNLKNINKNVQYQKRVFSKGNEQLIKEIDNFYSKKQN